MIVFRKVVIINSEIKIQYDLRGKKEGIIFIKLTRVLLGKIYFANNTNNLTFRSENIIFLPWKHILRRHFSLFYVMFGHVYNGEVQAHLPCLENERHMIYLAHNACTSYCFNGLGSKFDGVCCLQLNENSLFLIAPGVCCQPRSNIRALIFIFLSSIPHSKL